MCLLLNLSISIQLSVKKFFHCKQYIENLIIPHGTIVFLTISQSVSQSVLLHRVSKKEFWYLGSIVLMCIHVFIPVITDPNIFFGIF